MHVPSTEPRLRPPSLLLLALEGTRAVCELGATLATLPILHAAPRGDGHAVLIFPGLVASDLSTEPLRRYLRAQGYSAHEWGLGRNFGPRPGVLDACRDRIRQLRQESGGKVSLIGWSLGGIYAREMAKEMPRDVRSVITLGTPFRGSPRATNAWRVYEWASGETVDTVDQMQIERSPPVPTTSIFSRTDGVVAWQCSVEREKAQVENIEVEASHIGLGVHPAVLYAIADRLAQPEGAWKRFDRSSGLRGLFYKDPQRGSDPRATYGEGMGLAGAVL
ncbi:MAG: alpha/beta hydrolase [Methylobacteriaceae bacterium]|nr:alpha/beta hydrolase [Methylobacteriaceae bacterium]